MARAKYRKQLTYMGEHIDVSANTKKELDRKLAEKVSAIAAGQHKRSHVTVSAWKREWLETFKEPTVPERTYKNYTAILSHLEIQKELSDVTPSELQKFINSYKDYSYSFIQKLRFLIREMFETAVEEGLITKNPAAGLRLPDAKKGTHRALTDKERYYVESVGKTCEGGVYLLLMLYCGLRPSEAGTVQGRDFDFEKRMLHVRGTKSKAADRYVPVPDKLLPYVKDLKDEEYAVTDSNGRPTNQSTRRALWKRLKKEMNILAGCEMGRPYKHSPHDQPVGDMPIAEDLQAYCLRHTYCTDLERAGVPINVARDLMGHSDISITSKIYTHRSEDVYDEALRRINTL